MSSIQIENKENKENKNSSINNFNDINDKVDFDKLNKLIQNPKEKLKKDLYKNKSATCAIAQKPGSDSYCVKIFFQRMSEAERTILYEKEFTQYKDANKEFNKILKSMIRKD
ncbi:MAG: hypothetical protein M1168_00720 [Candidatus Marsarchaeota archaeon]|nr:hypothetical protein [Candidatus Marsarchaeota archaeon]MCL5094493.1 hypothetical protein [Candidatus Marsarchaeota archaeon]